MNENRDRFKYRGAVRTAIEPLAVIRLNACYTFYAFLLYRQIYRQLFAARCMTFQERCKILYRHLAI